MKFNIHKVATIPTTFKWQYVKWKFDISGEKIEDTFEWEIPIEWTKDPSTMYKGGNGTTMRTLLDLRTRSGAGWTGFHQVIPIDLDERPYRRNTHRLYLRHNGLRPLCSIRPEPVRRTDSYLENRRHQPLPIRRCGNRQSGQNGHQ